MFSFQSLLISSVFVSFSTGHMFMNTPKPFKFVTDSKSPLAPDGSDFPCKIPPGASYIADGPPTSMTVGENQTLSFTGTAVHGGGSCQIALTPGFAPTKDSSWMVIHSIEGGCPAWNQSGNLDESLNDPNTFTFTIPESIGNGENMTMGWTWANRIGGTELYMNCAPVYISPSKKKRMSFSERRAALSSGQAEYPELFLANLGAVSGNCDTSSAIAGQKAIAYPDPGASVYRPEGGDKLYSQPCDGNPRARTPPVDDGNDGTTTSQASASTASQSSQSIGSSTPSTSSSSLSTGASSGSVSPTSVSPSSDVESTSSIPDSTSPSSSAGNTASPGVVTVTQTLTTVVPPPPSSAPTPSTPSSSAIMSCPNSTPTPAPCAEGLLSCLPDGRQFAVCTGGIMSNYQQLSPEYKCLPGNGSGITIELD
ncbi:endoglucanase [Xylaria palmicola]|nr:endoglucanase [Xylaria palmicola]